jgi:short-subunit dehydrogenase
MADRRRALVTGASSGIGKELATLLAADAVDLVLAARSEPALRAVAAELSRDRGVKVDVVPCDLSDPSSTGRLTAAVDALGPIDFLVNNAGVGSSGGFLDLDLAREVSMIEVNVTSLIKLTHHFCRAMRVRGFGRVLNIASTAGFQPGPFMATYYASKAFVLSFSQALAFELAGTGVTVTCHCPGATATNFAAAAGNDRSRLFQRGGVADAPTVARHAYRAMQAGKVLAIQGTLNRFLVQALRVSPRATATRIAAGLNRTTERPS